MGSKGLRWGGSREYISKNRAITSIYQGGGKRVIVSSERILGDRVQLKQKG